jgi:hypothetical protein
LGDANWGANVSNYLIALATGSLQKAGGAFTLTSDVNFGATYGLISAYFKSYSSTIAATGVLRLANTDAITWRNSGNTADLPLSLASNALQFNGIGVVDVSSPQTLINKTLSGNIIANFSTTGSNLISIPALTDTLVTLTAPQNLTNKTVTGLSGTLVDVTGFGLRDTSASYDVTLAASSSTTLTAGRTVTIDTQNSSWTLKAGPLSNFSTLTDGGSGSVLSTLGSGSGYSWITPLTNPMTTLGDIMYENATPAATRLAGNTSITKNFLTQTGTGSASAAPVWGTIAAGDLPVATSSANGAVSTTTQTIAGAKTWNDVQTWYEGGGAKQVGSYNTSGSWTLGYVNTTSTSHQIYGQSGAYSTATPVLTISSSNATYAPGLNIGLDTSGTGNAWIQTFSSGSSNGVGLDFCSYEIKVGGYTGGGNWQLGYSGGSNTHNAYIGANGAFTVNVAAQSSGNNAYLTCGGASIGGYGYGGTYTTWPYINLVIPGNSQAYYWTAGNGNFMQSGTLSNVGTTTGTVVGTQTSDERLKTDIKPTKYGLDTVLALKPIDFVMHGQAKSGFGAQTTRSVLPEAVYDSGDKIAGHESEENKLGMDYVQIIPALVKAIQELEAQVRDLKSKINPT